MVDGFRGARRERVVGGWGGGGGRTRTQPREVHVDDNTHHNPAEDGRLRGGDHGGRGQGRSQVWGMVVRTPLPRMGAMEMNENETWTMTMRMKWKIKKPDEREDAKPTKENVGI